MSEKEKAPLIEDVEEVSQDTLEEMGDGRDWSEKENDKE